MPDYQDIWYQSSDGLQLYARDYTCLDAQRESPATVLCMHGLTRNSADFDALAQHLRSHYRVVAADQRGRGRSDYDAHVANYAPQTYVQDMFTLLDHLQLADVILVGTSMGGLMAFMMGAMQGARVRGMVINDVGPELDPRGLERIKAYVGKASPVRTWDDAVSQTRAVNAVAFPDFSDAQWLAFTRDLYREGPEGPVLAYDPAIAQPMDDAESGAVPPDLWPLFDALREIPMLLIRGASSDILAPACVETMQARHPHMQFAEIPQRGHAPTLTEPASLAAIDSFLNSL